MREVFLADGGATSGGGWAACLGYQTLVRKWCAQPPAGRWGFELPGGRAAAADCHTRQRVRNRVGFSVAADHRILRFHSGVLSSERGLERVSGREMRPDTHSSREKSNANLKQNNNNIQLKSQ